MRPVLLGMLATASLASATKCSQNSLFQDLVLKTSCGCPNKLAQCLRDGVDYAKVDDVQACFVASGCKQDDAALSAKLFVSGCQGEEVQEEQELRKRQNNNNNNNNDDDEEPAETTTSPKANTKEATTTSPKATTNSPKTTEVKTTEAKTTSVKETTAETSTPTTAEPTTSTPTPTDSTSDTSTKTTESTSGVTAQKQTTDSTTKTPLVCSTTSFKTTTACQTSAYKKVSCTPTVITTATCHPTNICLFDPSGKPACLVRDNSLTTSGLIVAITFGVAIIGVVASIIFLQLQASKVNKQQKLERAALLGATSRGFGATEANMPLINPEGAQRGAYNPEFESSYGDQGDIGGAQSASAPKLHPGLGGINQGYSRVE